MPKPQITSYANIHTGDVITLAQQSKIGLVFSVMKDTGGSVTSLKILPIHVHAHNFKHPNDTNNFMIPTGIKDELHLSHDEQYRVEFVLEDVPVVADEATLRYVKGNTSFFSARTIARMDDKIREERRVSAEAETEDRVFVFHKDVPTHVKERQRPSRPHAPNISIDDARQIELIGDTAYHVLTLGTYGRKQHVTTLREVYDLANSPKAAHANRFASILQTGLRASPVTLRTAFLDGALDETAAFNKLRDMDINRLGLALQLFDGGKSKGMSGFLNERFDAYDQDHFRIRPVLHIASELETAWGTFKEIAFNKPERLKNANIKYMYPT